MTCCHATCLSNLATLSCSVGRAAATFTAVAAAAVGSGATLDTARSCSSMSDWLDFRLATQPNWQFNPRGRIFQAVAAGSVTRNVATEIALQPISLYSTTQLLAVVLLYQFQLLQREMLQDTVQHSSTFFSRSVQPLSPAWMKNTAAA